MAEHHFARTAPSDGYQIAHAAADDQMRIESSSAQGAQRVKKAAWEQAIPVFQRDNLAAM
jgi:hypothetical protein